MSTSNEPIKSESDVPEVDDGSRIGNKESPPAPVPTSPPKNNSTAAEDSNPESKSLLPPADMSVRTTNGDPTNSKNTSAATEKQNKDSGMATPPRCDSPRLRQLLSSPPQERLLSPLIVSELQAIGILPVEVATGAIVPGTVKDAVVESGNVPEAVEGSVAAEANVPEAIQHAVPEEGKVPESVQASIVEGSNVPEAAQALEAEGIVPEIQASIDELNVPEAMESLPAIKGTIPEVQATAAIEGGVSEAEKMETSFEDLPPRQATGDEELKAFELTLTEDSSSFKKPTVSTRIQNMKGRLGDIKLEEPSVPESPKRRSARLLTLQRTHSESPSPKKERKSARPTLERTPSEEKMAARTRGQKSRLGSTSSNSEVEGSGDEGKGKRVSRKDSKK